MKNQITINEQTNQLVISKEFFDNPRAVIAEMPKEGKATAYALAEFFKEAADEAKKGLFQIEGLEKIAIPLPNGDTMLLTLSRGKETPAKATKGVDIEKAIAFAKEHNFPVPMTPRQVIEPQVDIEALQNLEWFQNNADQFSKWIEGKPTKSYDRIIKKINKKEDSTDGKK